MGDYLDEPEHLVAFEFAKGIVADNIYQIVSGHFVDRFVVEDDLTVPIFKQYVTIDLTHSDNLIEKLNETLKVFMEKYDTLQALLND